MHRNFIVSTLLIIYSTEKEDSNTVSDCDLNDDEEEGEQLLEYVELSEYEKRREERIAAINRKKNEIFGEMYRSNQPASITKKKKVHARKVCNNNLLRIYIC